LSKPFVIDGWLAEPDLNSFTRDGRTVRVEPKVMEVCVRLVQGDGSVVSKADLLESIWRDTAVGEDALTRAISELRRALDDDARNPRVIETIPKRGYRLIGTLHPAPSEGAAQPASPGSIRRRRPTIVVGAATAGVTVAVLAALLLTIADGLVPPGGRALNGPTTVLLVDVDGAGQLQRTDVLRRVLERELFSPVPRQRVSAALQRMRRHGREETGAETAMEIAARNGEIYPIHIARIERVDQEHVLTLHTADASTGRILRTVVAHGRDVQVVIRAASLGLDSLAAPSASQRMTPSVHR
jgi:DNA-binding winged helix-turn-helix (wHTH) protein